MLTAVDVASRGVVAVSNIIPLPGFSVEGMVEVSAADIGELIRLLSDTIRVVGALEGTSGMFFSSFAAGGFIGLVFPDILPLLIVPV